MAEGIFAIALAFTVISLGGLGLLYLWLRASDRELEHSLKQRDH